MAQDCFPGALQLHSEGTLRESGLAKLPGVVLSNSCVSRKDNLLADHKSVVSESEVQDLPDQMQHLSATVLPH